MKDCHSNLPLLFADTFATAIRLAVCLPMVLCKNGMGQGVVLIVSAIAIVCIGLPTRWVQKSDSNAILSNLIYRL
jgi:hypothetical protein